MTPPVSNPTPSAIEVIAPARLHLGFLDMDGGLGRKFGSLGITIDALGTRLECRKADKTTVTGPSAERAATVIERLSDLLGLRQPVNMIIHEAIPEHQGLGSGTQMALAAGAALTALTGTLLPPRRLAALLNRGARSGIGIAGFEQGGVILDGGRGPSTEVPPLLARLPFPDPWRIILISDPAHEGLSGSAEIAGFKALPPFPPELAGQLCRLILMRILPALAEADLEGFGSGVTQLQTIMGDHFATAQGGRFTSPNVALVLDWFQRQGIKGYGQSSWGPTGFVLVESQESAEKLLRNVSDGRYSPLRFTLCRGQNTGGTVSPLRAE